LTEPEPYGDTTTYQLGADWLADCPLVEDWGCGKGWLRTFIPADRYRGIDGSVSLFVDEVADLAVYRSEVAGVFIRHVLEHDYRWPAILDNAAASAQERLVVILFTPPADTTHEIAYAADPGVPDIAFCLEDLTDRLEGFTWNTAQYETATQYGIETVILAER